MTAGRTPGEASARRNTRQQLEFERLVHTSSQRLPIALALIVAAAGGALLDRGFPDHHWWAVVPLAVIMILASFVGRGFWSGCAVGFVAGAAFWLLHVEWLTLYLGAVPWLGLAGIQTVFFALGSGLIAMVLTRGPRRFMGRTGRIVIVPLIVGGLWTARETLTSTWPYGGFSWGRLAMSQTEGGLAPLIAWVGPSTTGFLIAVFAALVVQLVRETLSARARVPHYSSALQRRMPHLAHAVVAAVAASVLLLVPAWPAPTTGTIRLAAVQGGVDASLFTRVEPGEVFSAHLQQTFALTDDDLDLVVWPENGSDVDPNRDAYSAKALDTASELLDAPIVTGTITFRDDTYYNTSLQWRADEGVVDWYDKAHPVPFAEYVPDREFWRPFAPDLIDMIPRDYGHGTRDSIFDVGGVLAGIAICFDIAYDDLIDEMMAGGAEIILAQTNNADFGRTDESLQQLAIARMRAIETGRSVVNISTVGTSEIIGPDGVTRAALPTWTAGTMIDDVPVSTSVTPAVLLGESFKRLAVLIGLFGWGMTLFSRRR